MRFDKADLVAIIGQQREPVEGLDDRGKECLLSPAEAVAKAKLGGYYGVGNRRRIGKLCETAAGRARRLACKKAKQAREMLVDAAKTWTGREPARSTPEHQTRGVDGEFHSPDSP